MFSVVKVISLNAFVAGHERVALIDELRRAAGNLPAIRSVLAEPTLPGVYNGGDIIFRLQFDDRLACEAAQTDPAWRGVNAVVSDHDKVGSVQSAAYEALSAGSQAPDGGIYRVALFCANRNPTPDRLTQWERETAEMPRHVTSIRSWQLGRVAETSGSCGWTHVWEQEYDALDGLTGPYMMHPCHWAKVDRWFDPEYPEWLVDTELCHTFCATRAPVIVHLKTDRAAESR